MDEHRGWAIAQGFTDDEQPMLLRIRQFEDGFARDAYPHRLDISWAVSADAENGLPTKADMDAMQVFENRIVDAVETDAQSLLTLVLTGAGEREWVFYCRDQHEFVQRLSVMPHDGAAYPIRIEYELDEAWAFYDDFLPREEHDGEA